MRMKYETFFTVTMALLLQIKMELLVCSKIKPTNSQTYNTLNSNSYYNPTL